MLQKNALRAEMRRQRKTCPDRSHRDFLLFQRFISSALYQNAEIILGYVSFGTEADTKQILQRALLDKKDVYLPRCIPDTNRMCFYQIDSLSDLKTDAFGIPAPTADNARCFHASNPAVCLVPGLAFSAKGERLGYGKGYYDTFLEKIDVCTIGFCYDFQLLPTVPVEEHDKLMRFICTDQTLLNCRLASETAPFYPERKL